MKSSQPSLMMKPGATPLSPLAISTELALDLTGYKIPAKWFVVEDSRARHLEDPEVRNPAGLEAGYVYRGGPVSEASVGIETV